MKCDLCSDQDAVQYEVEYGWLRKVVTDLSHEKGSKTTYRTIGVLSQSVCSKCAKDYLRNNERWRRLGCWLGPIITALLFMLMLWINKSWGSIWWIPVFLGFMVFLYWSFSSIVKLAFRLFDRDAAFKEVIESEIWRSNVERLRQELHKLEPHFIFHPSWDRSSRNTHSQLGSWHYCESGGPIYKYYVKPRSSKAGTVWIH